MSITKQKTKLISIAVGIVVVLALSLLIGSVVHGLTVSAASALTITATPNPANQGSIVTCDVSNYATKTDIVWSVTAKTDTNTTIDKTGRLTIGANEKGPVTVAADLASTVASPSGFTQGTLAITVNQPQKSTVSISPSSVSGVRGGTVTLIAVPSWKDDAALYSRGILAWSLLGESSDLLVSDDRLIATYTISANEWRSSIPVHFVWTGNGVSMEAWATITIQSPSNAPPVGWMPKPSDGGYLSSQVNVTDTGEVTGEGEPTVVLFTDLKDYDWALEAINFVVGKGIMSGVSDGIFAPENKFTRADFVDAMAKLDGIDLSKYTESSFDDVAADAAYSKAVEWAAEIGMTNGVGNGKFDPDVLITREQMVTMFERYLNYKGITLKTVPAENAFADMDKVSDWAASAVKLAQESGLINGSPTDTENVFAFNPQENITRAEVALILYRFIQAIEK